MEAVTTHAYCMFCETQRCEAIAAYVEKTMPGWHCIYPRVIQRKWVRGVPTEAAHTWLPGYLFLYTETPDFPRLQISGVIRVLGGGELTGTDKDFADMIYRRNGVLGAIRLAEEGDRCVIRDPLWENQRGVILKIDRGRKRCCVEFEFDHIRRTVWVGYDLVKAEDPGNTEIEKEKANI